MYRIIEKIGQGSYGSVYRGEYRSNEKIVPLNVAIKKIHKPHTIREKKRIENEIRILSLLPSNIPGSIYLLDMYREPSYYCIVTNLIVGKVLPTKKYDDMTTKNIIRDILRFLLLCHTNKIAHRDIKPSNFIVSNNLITGIDFGLAAITNSDGMCSGSVGTPMYMSPESILSIKENNLIDGFKSDIWSVGVILYQLLYGYHPYNNENIILIYDLLAPMNFIKYDDTIDKSANIFLKKLLSFNPSNRPTIVEALQDPWLSMNDTFEDNSFFLYLDHLKDEIYEIKN